MRGEPNRAAQLDIAPSSGAAGAPPPLAIVLPRGEAIRNFLHSGVLDRLAAERPLLVLSVRPNESVWRALEERANWLVELAEIPERWPVRITRQVLDLAHGRWLWSEAARERWRLRDREASGSFVRRLKRGLKKTAARALAHPAGLRGLSALERWLSHRLRTTDSYLELFREVRPAILFNASHVHGRNAIQAVQAATWLGIPVAAFLFSWDNLTSQGRIIPGYDAYLAWTSRIRERLLELYPEVKPERVTVTGSPQFDLHFQSGNRRERGDFCRRIGADPERPIVFYSTGMPHHMPGEPRVVEGLAEALHGMQDLGPPQLLLRVYPKDDSGRFDALLRNRDDILAPPPAWEPRWLTPLPEDTCLYTNSLRHCAVGINIASTVSLELMLFDKPVVNVAFGSSPEDPADVSRYYRFEHYRPLVELGAVRLASSPEELATLVGEELRQPASRAANRRRALEVVLENQVDGRAGERVAAAIIALAGAAGDGSP